MILTVQRKVGLFVFLLLLTKQAYGANCQLSVQTEPEPQNPIVEGFYKDSLSLQSYALLEALIAKTDCTLEAVPLPKERAIKMLESGSLSVMVGLSKTVKREKSFYFVGSHHIERIVVVGHLDMRGRVVYLHDLLAVDGAISILGSAYYGADWEEALKSSPRLKDRLVYLTNNQRKLSMLTLGRVAFSLEDELVVDEWLKKKDYKEYFTKLFILHENPVYFAFSKKSISEERYMQLTETWQRMKNSGEVKAIKLKQQSNERLNSIGFLN